MAKKKELSAEELKEKKRIKEENSAIKSLITKVKKCCREGAGLSAVKLQRDFIRDNETILPNALLNRQTTVNCFNEGILAYEESIKL